MSYRLDIKLLDTATHEKRPARSEAEQMLQLSSGRRKYITEVKEPAERVTEDNPEL